MDKAENKTEPLMCGQVRAKKKKKKRFEYAKLNCRDIGYLNSVGKGDCEIKGCDKREIISSELSESDSHICREDTPYMPISLILK